MLTAAQESSRRGETLAHKPFGNTRTNNIFPRTRHVFLQYTGFSIATARQTNVQLSEITRSRYPPRNTAKCHWCVNVDVLIHNAMGGGQVRAIFCAVVVLTHTEPAFAARVEWPLKIGGGTLAVPKREFKSCVCVQLLHVKRCTSN